MLYLAISEKTVALKVGLDKMNTCECQCIIACPVLKCLACSLAWRILVLSGHMDEMDPQPSPVFNWIYTVIVYYLL